MTVAGDPAPGRRTGRTETAQTLDRGIRVLDALAARPRGEGMTVTDLAGEVGVGRTVLYRLLATLTAHDLVRRNADGRVVLGLGVNRWAAAVLPVVRESVTPLLRELADAVGATAHLTVAEGPDAVALVVVEPSWTDFHVAYRRGSRHPLDRGAAGRAILGGRAGEAGVVTSDGELQPGASGAAAPVLGVATMEASVGVVSLSPLDTAVVGPRVVATAALVTEVLAGGGAPRA